MKSRQICGLIAALTILTTATAMPLLIGLPISAHAQNTTATAPLSESQSTNTAQIKNYLTEAINSLDSGNTTRALEQVDLAGDQLETLAGGTVSDDEREERGEVEEGSGEDVDEPGDIDDNDDKEDSP
jgi:hypothetical protein